MVRHAAIVPLIGGEVIASMNSFGEPPQYILSYDPFLGNEKHLVNYLFEQGHSVRYHMLDSGGSPGHLPKVAVVSTLCPCAGLSQLSRRSHADNPTNEWMYHTAEYVLENIKPYVFWGENAPTFGSEKGKKVRDRLYEIGRKNGYSMTVYRTKSILHGLGQIRDRAFYFFWKGNSTPILNYFRREHERIEDTISNVKSNFQMESINPKVPSRDDPCYRYLLEVVLEGATHRQAFDLLPDGRRSQDAMSHVEAMGHTQKQMGDWLLAQGYENEAAKCFRRQAKRDDGKGYMYRNSIVPKDYIGAFVSNYPCGLTHPYEDRYITYREAMTIMGLPSNFELLDPKRTFNHVCQNVPVGTATDMCDEIKAVLGGDRQMLDSTYTFQWNQRRESASVEDVQRGSLEALFA